MESVNGVYANRDTWAAHNFYPQNGMVGEVVKQTSNAYVIKILDGIYVPMSPRGIKTITAQEYQAGLKNNVCSGMDERQRSINSRLDDFNERTGYDWHKFFK